MYIHINIYFIHIHIYLYTYVRVCVYCMYIYIERERSRKTDEDSDSESEREIDKYTSMEINVEWKLKWSINTKNKENNKPWRFEVDMTPHQAKWMQPDFRRPVVLFSLILWLCLCSNVSTFVFVKRKEGGLEFAPTVSQCNICLGC